MTEGPDLRGTWFVLPTPFTEDRSVDLNSQRTLVEAAISWEVDGVTAMGVTSEASELTPSERSAALAAVAEAADGRVPLVVGCSDVSPQVTVDRMREATAAGAVAAMVSAPPGHRNLGTLPSFFARVAGEGRLPLVVQDEPAATGVVIPPELLLRCLESSGARTVKLEDAPTPPKIARLLEADPGLQVFGGLGGVSALEELERGACGTMTGFAFPEILRAVRQALHGGDAAGAAAVFHRFLPLIRYEAQPNVGLAVRKELLRRRGVIRTAVTRRTGPLTEDVLRGLDEVLGRVGVEPGPEPMEVD